MFTLTSVYVLAKRPAVNNAIQINFAINFNSLKTYPNHYLEFLFRDIDISAIPVPNNVVGTTVPCTFSSLFVAIAGRPSPSCVIGQTDNLGTLTIRITQIGNLLMGPYQLSLDFFTLPSLANLFQPTKQFTLCLRFHTVTPLSQY